jgi:hypothetical protein
MSARRKAMTDADLVVRLRLVQKQASLTRLRLAQKDVQDASTALDDKRSDQVRMETAWGASLNSPTLDVHTIDAWRRYAEISIAEVQAAEDLLKVVETSARVRATDHAHDVMRLDAAEAGFKESRRAFLRSVEERRLQAVEDMGRSEDVAR